MEHYGKNDESNKDHSDERAEDLPCDDEKPQNAGNVQVPNLDDPPFFSHSSRRRASFGILPAPGELALSRSV